MSTVISDSIEKWAKIALEQKWVNKWIEEAIFPREMVFFLAACEANGVVNIIESGRQDGYSTEIMAFYVQQQNGRAYSIDFELDRERADRCRLRLSGNPNLAMLKGDGVGLIGALLVAEKETPTAVLIDGPKDYLAMGLLFAAAAFSNVRVVAQHNLEIDKPELLEVRQKFVELVPEPHFYEDIDGIMGENWASLAKAEKNHCTQLRALRSLEYSSLGLIQVTEAHRKNLLMTNDKKFGTKQPLRFYQQWQLSSQF